MQEAEEQQCHLGYLEVVNHGDVSGRCTPDGVIYNRISLWSGDTTGGQDLVILVHTQRLLTQILYRQGLTVTHQPIIIHYQLSKSTANHDDHKAFSDDICIICSPNLRVNHFLKLQNTCNQFGSKPVEETSLCY